MFTNFGSKNLNKKPSPFPIIPTYITSMKILKDEDTKPEDVERIEKQGPNILEILSGQHKGTVHIQIKRFDSSIEPHMKTNGQIDKKKVANFLNTQWQVLDQDIEYLKQHGTYPEKASSLAGCTDLTDENGNLPNFKAPTVKYIPNFVSEATKKSCRNCFYASSVYSLVVCILFGIYVVPKMSILHFSLIGVVTVILVLVITNMSDPEKSSNKVIKAD